jgi:hypothetical protein
MQMLKQSRVVSIIEAVHKEFCADAEAKPEQVLFP